MPLKRPNGFSPSRDIVPVFRFFFIDAQMRRVTDVRQAVAVRVTGPLDCADVPMAQLHHPSALAQAMERCIPPQALQSPEALPVAAWAQEASFWALDELADLARETTPSLDSILPPRDPAPQPTTARGIAVGPIIHAYDPAPPAGAARPDEEDDLAWPSADPPSSARASTPHGPGALPPDPREGTGPLDPMWGLGAQPRWSWEPHGDGWTLYEGRSSTQHGLSRLFVPKDGFDARGDLLRAQILRGLSMATAKTRFDPLALQATVQQQIDALQATLLSLVDDLQATHAECAQGQMDATAAQSTKLANALSQIELAEGIIRKQRAQIAALEKQVKDLEADQTLEEGGT